MARIGMLFFKIPFALLLHSCRMCLWPECRAREILGNSLVHIVPMVFISSESTEKGAIAFLCVFDGEGDVVAWKTRRWRGVPRGQVHWRVSEAPSGLFLRLSSNITTLEWPGCSLHWISIIIFYLHNTEWSLSDRYNCLLWWYKNGRIHLGHSVICMCIYVHNAFR